MEEKGGDVEINLDGVNTEYYKTIIETYILIGIFGIVNSLQLGFLEKIG